MTAYFEHRARRLWAAEQHEGWGLPPYPWMFGGRMIGRVVMAGPEAGFYPPSHEKYARLKSEAAAREKAQNRTLPK